MIPQQNSYYTVQKGDTTRNIARKAYGRDAGCSLLIYEANYELLKNRPVSLEGLPMLYVGDSLFIPPFKNKYDNKPITADFDSQIKIKIEGRFIEGAKAGSITRAMNTISGGFVCDIPFDPSDKELLQILSPFAYANTELFIGGELYLTAEAVHHKITTSQDGNIITIDFRTKSGNMIECNGMRQTRTFKSGLTLLEIVRQVASPYGITCYASSGSGGKVTAQATNSDMKQSVGRVEQEITETDADFLQKLCTQKGFLLATLPTGDLLLCRANTEDSPSDSIIEGQDRIKAIETVHDGTKRFRCISGSTAINGNPSISYSEKDESVKVNRTMIIEANECDNVSIQTAVKWKLAKSVAESYKVSVVLSGWRNSDGMLWEDNMKITILAPSAFIFKETEFIIESVQLTKDESGDVAALEAVLPNSYTTQIPKAPYPWQM